MAYLLYLTPIGLALDIVGFVLVVAYGHNLFMRVVAKPPRQDDKGFSRRRIYLESAGSDLADARRPVQKAYCGVAIVVLGFVLQIAGATVGILLG